MIDVTNMPADRRVGLVLAMVHVGAGATLLLLATLVFDLPDFVDGLPQGVLLVALGVIFRRQLRDEYVQQLWDAGTATAFVALTAGFLLAPVVAGLAGRVAGAEWLPTSMTVRVQWPAAVALLGFHAGFYWRMLAGTQGPARRARLVASRPRATNRRFAPGGQRDRDRKARSVALAGLPHRPAVRDAARTDFRRRA